MVRDVTPERSYGYGWYGLNETEPSEGKGAVRYLVYLETYHYREGPAREGEKPYGTDEEAYIGYLEGIREMMLFIMDGHC